LTSPEIGFPRDWVPVGISISRNRFPQPLMFPGVSYSRDWLLQGLASPGIGFSRYWLRGMAPEGVCLSRQWLIRGLSGDWLLQELLCSGTTLAAACFPQCQRLISFSRD
jgi:hypothetical protein